MKICLVGEEGKQKIITQLKIQDDRVQKYLIEKLFSLGCKKTSSKSSEICLIILPTASILGPLNKLNHHKIEF